MRGKWWIERNKMHITDMMEQFNFAYIHALSASCGFNIGTQAVDNDSIDMMIFTKRGVHVGIQLKSTLQSSVSQHIKSDGIYYSLPQKNYNDLRGDFINPRYLFLLVLPDDPQLWLPEHQLIQQKCYWLNLSQAPENQNKTTTVIFPVSQVLTNAVLSQMIQRATKGQTL